ncbi:50S ribosomal protein L11 methyltransferase [Mucilaginibacter calamicampi]|uniref:Ribosomal protein L11 methyltransferase n=1 Tax=Mucilaginibacter calamicampi TaxID=1302352 RepID=A0ABW2YW77_9SPHI
MNYYEISFTVEDDEGYRRDLLINGLGEIGFDTFEETETGFNAYIPADTFKEDLFTATLNPFFELFPFSHESNFIEQKNWNEVWESNFEPLVIGDKIYVRATFHQPRPDVRYEIVIDPKMAFGTGHHQTTSMILQLMLDEDFTGKKVLDMGCGTGILAIMAAKLNAGNITAIDYDPVCYESTIENAQLNGITSIKALCGSKEAIPAEQFDIILANINRNILLDQMDSYAAVLKPAGTIFFSGFYETPDLEIITQAANQVGLTYISHKKDKDWVAAKFVKHS